jgi:hypothetical protein
MKCHGAGPFQNHNSPLNSKVTRPHLPVCAQDRDVSRQILDLRRLHRPLEPRPVPRTQLRGHDEIQALAKRVRRVMPE